MTGEGSDADRSATGSKRADDSKPASTDSATPQDGPVDSEPPEPPAAPEPVKPKADADVPATDAAVGDAAVEDAPVEDVAVEDAPVEDAAVEDAPVEDAQDDARPAAGGSDAQVGPDAQGRADEKQPVERTAETVEADSGAIPREEADITRIRRRKWGLGAAPAVAGNRVRTRFAGVGSGLRSGRSTIDRSFALAGDRVLGRSRAVNDRAAVLALCAFGLGIFALFVGFTTKWTVYGVSVTFFDGQSVTIALLITAGLIAGSALLTGRYHLLSLAPTFSVAAVVVFGAEVIEGPLGDPNVSVGFGGYATFVVGIAQAVVGSYAAGASQTPTTRFLIPVGGSEMVPPRHHPDAAAAPAPSASATPAPSTPGRSTPGRSTSASSTPQSLGDVVDISDDRVPEQPADETAPAGKTATDARPVPASAERSGSADSYSRPAPATAESVAAGSPADRYPLNPESEDSPEPGRADEESADRELVGHSAGSSRRSVRDLGAAGIDVPRYLGPPRGSPDANYPLPGGDGGRRPTRPQYRYGASMGASPYRRPRNPAEAYPVVGEESRSGRAAPAEGARRRHPAEESPAMDRDRGDSGRQEPQPPAEEMPPSMDRDPAASESAADSGDRRAPDTGPPPEEPPTLGRTPG